MPRLTTDEEQAIRAAWCAGEMEAAANATLERYGAEIMSFLHGRLGDQNHAQEVFAMFAEDFWVGLAGFGWRCSMRTWVYTLSRNAAIRYVTDPRQRAKHNLTLSASNQVSMLMEQVRTATQLHEQTSAKDRVRELRAQLHMDDQLLLVLRVDRGMAWRDVAMTMLGDIAVEEAALEKRAAQLRKQFERIKAEIRRLAIDSGLLKTE